jgi:Domain of unknown function (DUF222)
MAADRQPPSRDDILETALAALTEDGIPPDEECLGWPDPDCGPPPELAGLSTPELDELITAQPAPVAEIGPAGFLPRDRSGGGYGFADGGELDVLDPGVPLAGFADDAHARLAALTDDELIGVLRAWRRQTSWAQARELAAMAELARRRPAERTAPAAAGGAFAATVSEFTADEVAMALTLTGRAAGAELDLALDMAARPATAAALETGAIDLPRAKVMITAVSGLAEAHAAAVEAQILPRAAGMTTGQLRAAVQRAVLAADPEAARRRREEAEQEVRVEHWADPEGTATLAGRGLPPAAALTASKRLTQIATAWKKHGAVGGMDLLRAHAYLALLNGQSVGTPPASLFPPGLVPATPGPATGGGQHVASVSCPDGATAAGGPAAGGPQVPSGLGHPGPGDALAAGEPPLPAGLRGPGADGLPPAAGLINLIVPLTTLLGLADAPGESAGYGPLDADTARLLARTLAGHPATRWQITITSPGGQALAHGTARGRAAPVAPVAPVAPGGGQPGPTRGESSRGWTLRVTAEPITAGRCDHRTAEPGYRPSPALQRLVRARTVTCAGPGCRRPAARCDLDHTIAHDQGGITCECNLGTACRHCHRLKQARGWRLEQASPGVMTWTTPAGRRYTTLPSKHPT